MKTKLRFRDQRGTSFVEFAMILPLLIILLFGIVEFSIILYDKAVLTNASREGVYPSAEQGMIAMLEKSYAPDRQIKIIAPGSFFLQTKQGWVHVGEGAFPTFVGRWMKIFGMAGPGETTPSTDWAPGQSKRFCLQ